MTSAVVPTHLAAVASFLLLAACGSDAGLVTLTLAPAGGTVRVATYDTTTGAVTLAAADLDSMDAVPVSLVGARGALLRDRDQLVVLEGDGLTVARRIDVNDPGDTTSAQAVAVVAISSSKAYVLRRARNTVLVVDPSKDGAAARLGTIDLASFGTPLDTDGLVDVAAGALVGTRVFVACARSYVDTTGTVFPAASIVAVIDTATDTLFDADGARPGVQAIDLEQSGPVAVASSAGRVFVASSALPGMADGGIEAVDPGTFSTRTITSEATLTPAMASVGELHGLVAAGGKLVAIAADRAVVVDPSTGDVGDTLVPSRAVAATVLANGDVVVGLTSSLTVFDASSSANLTSPSTPLAFDAMRALLGVSAR